MSGVSSVPSGSYYVNYSPYAPTIPDDAVGTGGMSGQACYPEEEVPSIESNVSINFDQPALEDRNPPPSVGQAALGGAFGFTSVACDCGGVQLTGDGEDTDVVEDEGDGEPDEIPSEVEGDFSYEDYVDEYYDEATDEAGEEDYVEMTDETPSEVEGEDYYEDWADEGEAPSACDHSPEPFDLTSPADGLVGVPYYSDSAIDISFPYPHDPDEAIGDVVTCYAEIDDDSSFSTPITREVPEPGNLAFTPDSPAEYFTCATPYQVRVRCVDTCGNITASTTSRTFETGPTVEWTRTYNGAGNGVDMGSGIVIGPSGNLYVIGSTQTGTERWAVDIWLRGYDVDGNPLWTQTYNYPYTLSGDNRQDYGHDIASSASGDLYAIGEVNAGRNPMFGADTDVWIASYREDGTPNWTNFYNSFDNIMFDFDRGNGIAVDDVTTDIFVAGSTSLSDTEQNVFWLGRYSSSGTGRWVLSDSGIGSGRDIAISNSGSRMYTIGNVYASGGDSNIWIRTHNIDGSPVWTQIYDDLYSGDDFGEGVATDASENAYVTGVEYIGGGIYQPWTARYDSTGHFVWGQSVGRSGITTDDLGSVYVTGGSPSRTPATTSNTTRVNAADGEIICEIPESSAVSPAAVAVDNDGNVFLAGSESVPGEDNNIWVRRYSGF